MIREDGDGRRWKTPAQALDVLRKLRDAGVDQPIFNMPFVENAATLEYVAEKIIAPVASW
jgi:hypothetical protein